MRRRAALALLAATLTGAPGCAGTPGDDPATPTTAAPTGSATGTDAPTDTRSVTSDGESTRSGTPPAGVTPAAGSCEPERPAPADTGAYEPPGYPDPPAAPTGDDARDYLAAFETAYHANRLVAEGSAPGGTVVADVTLDARVVRVREGPGWTLAGVATDGSVGYAPAPAGDDGDAGNASGSTGTGTATHTPTPVPGITVHSRASYYLTDAFLVGQDRGHDGEPSAAVSTGTVVACVG